MNVRRLIMYIWIAVAFVIAVVVSLFIDYSASPVYARGENFHVVIDAGHGGRDLGASGRGGVTERDINLAIARFLEGQLVSQGVDVTLTRKNEHSLANPYARNQKKSDMEERRKIIEQVKPDLVVSIHLNSLPTHPMVRGAQAFYASGTQKKTDGASASASQQYAESIQSAFNDSSLDMNRRAATGSYFILECTQYPSVLVECGFLSNYLEEKLLADRQYQKLVAQFIADGILRVI